MTEPPKASPAIAYALLLGGEFKTWSRYSHPQLINEGPIERHACYIPTPGANFAPEQSYLGHLTAEAAALSFLSDRGYWMTTDGDLVRI